MKKLSFIIFVLIFCQITASSQTSQPCLPTGITFTTQAEIDNFQTNHPNCTEIEGVVTISGIDITNLNGLNVLTSIGGYLSIWNNAALTSLTGLDNLTSVGGNLYIEDNDALTSLTGLDNIDANTISELRIIDNSSLSTCEVQSVCDYLANPSGTIEINNNATGCNTQAEVEAACEAIGLPDIIFESELSIYPNPATERLTISSKDGLKIAEIVIYNQIGQKVLHHKPVTQPIDVSMLQPGRYIIEVNSQDLKIREKLIIR